MLLGEAEARYMGVNIMRVKRKWWCSLLWALARW